jgi:histidine phosphotransferase ChpT
MAKIALDTLDLAALLCSRVCHDVISPVGAIVNGLEVLEDENESSMRDFALDLIKKSARQASAKLQFCRLAFGAAGSAGAMIDLGDAENVAKGFLNDDKLKLVWEAPRLLLPKNQVKLLLNLLLIASSSIPRGGSITAKVEMRDEEAVFMISAKGINARIPTKVEKLLIGEHENETLDAHAVQPYYTGLLAQSAGRVISFSLSEETMTIMSKPGDMLRADHPVAVAGETDASGETLNAEDITSAQAQSADEAQGSRSPSEDAAPDMTILKPKLTASL